MNPISDSASLIELRLLEILHLLLTNFVSEIIVIGNEINDRCEVGRGKAF